MSSPSPSPALLNRVGGDKELLAELCELFLEDAPARLADIRAALDAGDPAAAARTAHAFKGSAAVFEAATVVEAARQLELLGRAGNLAAAEPMWQVLARESAMLLQVVRGYRTDIPCGS